MGHETALEINNNGQAKARPDLALGAGHRFGKTSSGWPILGPPHRGQNQECSAVSL